MIRTAAIALVAALAVTGPAPAAPNAQLVASVQHRLNSLGFREVDASTLSSRQIAALHLQLQGRHTQRFGLDGLRARSKVRVILGWEQ